MNLRGLHHPSGVRSASRHTRRRRTRATALLLAVSAALPVLAAAQTDEERPARRVSLYPGAIQVREGDVAIDVAFGVLDEADERAWSLLPIRVAVAGEQGSAILAINGLSLLTRNGVRYGRERVVDGSFDGDVINVGGPIIVHGHVSGSVWAFGADISLGPNSRVAGDAISVGGQVVAESGAVVLRNVQSLPGLSIPFIGSLSSPQAAITFRFIIEALSALLFLLVLFLVVHFGAPTLVGIATAVGGSWKDALLYLLLALVLVPAAIALLAASVVGLVFVPLLAMAVVAIGYLGLLGVSVRAGALFRGQVEGAAGPLYLRAVLGYALLKVPMLVGLLFQGLTATLLIDIGEVLSAISTVLIGAAVAYGFGATLAFRRAAR